MSVGGARDYAARAWRHQDAAEYATYGVRSVDVANAMLDCAFPALQVAGRQGVPGVCYVHDAEFNTEEMHQIPALDCHLAVSRKRARLVQRYIANLTLWSLHET